jgi:DNA-binding transcriptional MerR regulator
MLMPTPSDALLTARRPVKSAAAFRTISEVADDLEVPQHVLRFWETKFPQIKPLKRGGGRRYYRPEDVLLLRRIRQCLYHEGYTIKGVQRLLREGALKEPAGSPAPAQPSLPILQRLERPAPGRASANDDSLALLRELRDELQELREMLRRSMSARRA